MVKKSFNNDFDFYEAVSSFLGDRIPIHNEYDSEKKLYWNVFKDKWCTNRCEKEIIKTPMVSLYNFKYFSVYSLKFYFGNKDYEKAAMFLTRLYQQRYSSDNSQDWSFVYWTEKDLRTIIYKDWRPIVNHLLSLKLIQMRVSVSKYNSKSFKHSFRLSKNFIVKDGVNYKITYLKDPGYQDRVIRYFENISINVDKSPVIQSIRRTIGTTNCIIENLDEQIDEMWESKRIEAEKSKWNEFLVKKERKKMEVIRTNPNSLKNEYNRVIRGFYNQLNLINQSKFEIEKRALFRIRTSSFGNRISHLYSNVPKEFRKHMTIDGESVVEIDINASQPSFFCVLIRKWYSMDLMNMGNVDVPLFDDSFYEIIVESVTLDFYKTLSIKLNGSTENKDKKYSRAEMKKLFNRLMYGNPLHDINGKSKEYWISKIFGPDIYKFVETLAKTDLGIKNESTHKNLSALLHREESAFLMKVMERLVEQNVKFLPLYDSLIIKNSDKDIVENAFLEIINTEGLNNIIRIK